ncbi:MAG: SH3 domain-containing protein [Candidatus Riflebacteria bacterium]|nr:SH3 domain-containing protein [Candidatus Riflebacteria bacterium]
MKKAKIISIVVIVLSVVALGVFMGKQMFKLMEAGSTQKAPETASGASDSGSSVKILYTAETGGTITTPVIEAATMTTPVQMPGLTQKPTEDIAAVKTASDAFDPNGPKWFAYASGNGVNVRNGPSTGEKLLFKVGKGTRGVVVEKKDGWTNIKWDFNRKTGWVRDDLLIQGPAAVMGVLIQKTEDLTKIDAKQIGKASAQEAIKESLIAVAIAKPAIASETVNTYVQGKNLPKEATIQAQTFATVRSAPNTSSEKISRLPKGMLVKIKSVRKEGRWQWFEIIFNEGRKTGWTREDNLKFSN